MADPSFSDLPNPAVAQVFRLRPDGPRVTCLSRNVLIGGSALALILIGRAVLWPLQGDRLRGALSQEHYSTDRPRVADGLAGLPRDYAVHCSSPTSRSRRPS